jgi:hypothetical protein
VLLSRSGRLGENALEHENEQGEKQERQQSQRQQENDKKGRQFQNDKHKFERQEQATAHGIYLLAVYITQRGFYSFTLARGIIACELFHCLLRNAVREARNVKGAQESEPLGAKVMNHRKFVVTSTVILFFVAGIAAGLALFSGMQASASMPDLPKAVRYLPADYQAVFGMNVQKFVASPVFAKFEAKQGENFGNDLAEFSSRTGVDPRRDVDYIIAGGKSLTAGGHAGVVIAVGRFNTAAITSFINTQAKPITLQYKDATVQMIPEADGSNVEKGIAFLTESEIAMGDLESLKAVLDVRENPQIGIEANKTLAPLLESLNPDDMFWFAGDPSNVLSKVPTNTPMGSGLSSIKYVYGTLNLTDAVSGKITVTAYDKEAAAKLADIARGLVALGQLASEQNPEAAELLKGIGVAQNTADDQILLTLNFPLEVLDRLEHAKPIVR